MRFFWIFLISIGSQAEVTITKRNGESIQLSNIRFHHSADKASDQFITFVKNGTASALEIAKLKRINLKESIKRTKGVTTWRVILVEKDNSKHEVSMNLVEVSGNNSDGELIVVPSGSIDKLTL